MLEGITVLDVERRRKMDVDEVLRGEVSGKRSVYGRSTRFRSFLHFAMSARGRADDALCTVSTTD